MSEQRIAVARFDVEAVEPSLRYDAWRENMGVLFDVKPVAGSRPGIDRPTCMESVNLGGVVFARTRAGAQVFSRDLRRLRRDGMGVILVQYFCRGGGVITGGQGLSPGGMTITDSEQPYEFVASDYENLNLLVPYDLKDTISPALEVFHGRTVPGINPMVQLLGDHMRSLWRHAPDMTPAQAVTALRGTLGLLRGWLADEPGIHGELDPAVVESLTATMRRYIDRNLAKPLRVEDLARRFRVSRTQIYRLFKPHGGVARYLWERRLQRAHTMLSSPVYRWRCIGAIAFECGFGSEAHFSRAFRARFGQTAREVRAGALDRTTCQTGQRSGERGYSTDVYRMIKSLASADRDDHWDR